MLSKAYSTNKTPLFPYILSNIPYYYDLPLQDIRQGQINSCSDTMTFIIMELNYKRKAKGKQMKKIGII